MRLSGTSSRCWLACPSSSVWSSSPARPRPTDRAAGAAGLKAPEAVAVLREAAKPYVLAGLQAFAGRPIVLVASDSGRAQEWYGDLLTWTDAPERVLHVPAFDALPFEQLPAVPETVAARVGALIQLSAPGPGGARRPGRPGPGKREDPGAPFVVVTSVQALQTRLAQPEAFGGWVISLRAGQRYDLERLVRQLAASGYERAGLVETPGSFSQRGGIVDIFPPLADGPVRLEFFGDEVESIRSFDPATQRSTEPVEHFQLAPATELPLWQGAAGGGGAARSRLVELCARRSARSGTGRCGTSKPARSSPRPRSTAATW